MVLRFFNCLNNQIYHIINFGFCITAFLSYHNFCFIEKILVIRIFIGFAVAHHEIIGIVVKIVVLLFEFVGIQILLKEILNWLAVKDK